MIRKVAELSYEPRKNFRDGTGTVHFAEYLGKFEMSNLLIAGRITLEPGSSIGTHTHPDTEEIYLILEGHGQGNLDGAKFPVGPGDLFVCKAGHNHGLQNTTTSPLTIFTAMTEGQAK